MGGLTWDVKGGGVDGGVEHCSIPMIAADDMEYVRAAVEKKQSEVEAVVSSASSLDVDSIEHANGPMQPLYKPLARDADINVVERHAETLACEVDGALGGGAFEDVLEHLEDGWESDDGVCRAMRSYESALDNFVVHGEGDPKDRDTSVIDAARIDLVWTSNNYHDRHEVYLANQKLIDDYEIPTDIDGICSRYGGTGDVADGTLKDMRDYLDGKGADNTSVQSKCEKAVAISKDGKTITDKQHDDDGRSK
jgi:hypothetical protein